VAELLLTPEELVELTHCKRNAAQAAALASMGIWHQVRPDGTLAVSRAHVEAILAGAGRSKPVRQPKLRLEDDEAPAKPRLRLP